MTRWRPFIVFGFGLIHGMGFAGFFGSLGLPDGQFWSALIGFNIGVELGQLSVIALAALLLWPLRRVISDAQYRHFIVWPICGFIGTVGAYWASERLLAGLTAPALQLPCAWAENETFQSEPGAILAPSLPPA